VASAKQKIASYPNQGRRPNTHSSHLVGFHVVLVPGFIVRIVILSLYAEGRQSNDQTAQ
jgi:hypothetical protein